MPALGRLLRRAVDVREHETTALVASCAYFFFVLSAYYVIRPVRDEMGVAGGYSCGSAPIRAQMISRHACADHPAERAVDPADPSGRTARPARS